ncbi:DoxX family protein [Chitinophaga rhizosphaerae]|uniref:DoxX family protein n=1 Tax=Chitinophaga rhizosphaerae TaxID=1864947 RepID=UPI000F806BF0|nr:DoxX family protein [Chitinophaga rhizosphaerae]
MKTTKIIFWITTIAIFLFEGVMPISTLIFTPEYTYIGTRPLGYPDYFALALIFFKLAGTLAILLPQVPGRLKEWAYAGLTFNLVFAVISHVVVDGNIAYVLMPIVVMGVLAGSYFSWHKIHAARSRQKEDGLYVRSMA